MVKPEGYTELIHNMTKQQQHTSQSHTSLSAQGVGLLDAPGVTSGRKFSSGLKTRGNSHVKRKDNTAEVWQRIRFDECTLAATEKAACETYKQTNGLLTFDMGQPFATPAMLKSAVECLLSAIKNGVAMLAAQLSQFEGNARPPRLYTREELAEYLGVGLTTLDTMRQDPTFPSIHLTDARNRGSVRFDLNEVLQHLRTKNAILRGMAR